MSQSNVAGHPLRPANDRRLGKPLPYQLANHAQAHPQAKQTLLSSCNTMQEHIRYYPMFPWAIPNLEVDHLRVTHPFATLTKVQAPQIPFDLHA